MEGKGRGTQDSGKEERVIKGWLKFADENKIEKASEAEKARFQEVRDLDEKAQNIKFVLGEPLSS